MLTNLGFRASDSLNLRIVKQTPRKALVNGGVDRNFQKAHYFCMREAFKSLTREPEIDSSP